MSRQCLEHSTLQGFKSILVPNTASITIPILSTNLFFLFFHPTFFSSFTSICTSKCLTFISPGFASRHVQLYIIKTAIWLQSASWSFYGLIIRYSSLCWVGFRRLTYLPISEIYHCCFYYNSCRWLSWVLRCVAIFCAVAFISQYMRPENCEIMDGNICVCDQVGKILIIHAVKSRMSHVTSCSSL